jgi:Concanavalin A-like lectin/glucanases superfamily
MRPPFIALRLGVLALLMSYTAVTAAHAIATCALPAAGMVGWWPGDGNANDIVGGDNGTLQGGATYAAGEVGEAFSLNGTDAFVLAPDVPDLDPTSAGSQDAWVKFNQLPSVAGHIMEIIGKGGFGTDFDLQAEADNRFHFYIAAGAEVSSTTTIQTGVWYHVAGTWDSKTGLKIYVNGVLEGTNAALVTRTASGAALMIGNQPAFGPRLFNGLIDEVQVFDRALTAAEVETIFEAGSTGQCKVGRCVASATTLCIDDIVGDHRFAVTASYKTSQDNGQSGSGEAIPLASLGVTRGGLLWFFSADNPEMLIKVINACSLNQQYWVFFAALTNVGFTLNVNDTITGGQKTYSNKDLTTAAPVQDTSALPCD